MRFRISGNTSSVAFSPSRIVSCLFEKSLIIGSVTRSVTLNSTKPVLVIKPQQHEEPGKVKILFATDGSHSANETGK